MDNQGERYVEITDMSGGIQEKTTEFLRKANELDEAQNSRFDTIGGVKASGGYAEVGSDLTSTTSTSTSSSTTTTSTSTSSSTSSSTSTSTTTT